MPRVDESKKLLKKNLLRNFLAAPLLSWRASRTSSTSEFTSSARIKSASMSTLNKSRSRHLVQHSPEVQQNFGPPWFRGLTLKGHKGGNSTYLSVNSTHRSLNSIHTSVTFTHKTVIAHSEALAQHFGMYDSNTRYFTHRNVNVYGSIISIFITMCQI